MYFKSMKCFTIKTIFSVMCCDIKIVFFTKILNLLCIRDRSAVPATSKMENVNNECHKVLDLLRGPRYAPVHTWGHGFEH